MKVFVCNKAVIEGSYSNQQRSNSRFGKARYSKKRERIRRQGQDRGKDRRIDRDESERKSERKTDGPIQRANLQRPSPAIRRTVATQQHTSAHARSHAAGPVLRRYIVLLRVARYGSGNFGFVMVISRSHEIIRQPANLLATVSYFFFFYMTVIFFIPLSRHRYFRNLTFFLKNSFVMYIHRENNKY